jgi:transcriptional regulator with XRE-family HTH domain
MDRQLFLENVKKKCAERGVKPTVACVESGAGRNLLTQLANKGTVPSVERVQMLAQYLGCAVSDLLGEKEAPPDPVRQEFMRLLDSMTAEQQNELFAFMLRLKRGQEK